MLIIIYVLEWNGDIDYPLPVCMVCGEKLGYSRSNGTQ